MKQEQKRIMLILIFVISFVALVFALASLIKREKVAKQNDEDLSNLKEKMTTQEELNSLDLENDVLSEEIVEESTVKEAEFLSFDALKAYNPDIIGWIEVDGTVINYPILCSQSDNSYYLTHDYKGEYDSQGAIYIENINSIDFTDFNTVLYGHSMINGRMFRALHYFGEDQNFFNTYGNITIYLPNRTLKYKVFECAYMDNINIFSNLDNSSEASINNFIADLTTKYRIANIRNEYTITPQSRIITLSTCTIRDNIRIGVFALLIEENYAEN